MVVDARTFKDCGVQVWNSIIALVFLPIYFSHHKTWLDTPVWESTISGSRSRCTHVDTFRKLMVPGILVFYAKACQRIKKSAAFELFSGTTCPAIFEPHNLINVCLTYVCQGVPSPAVRKKPSTATYYSGNNNKRKRFARTNYHSP